tara:strand:- start:3548 stop:4765 length:1218 start_codon:yes stop_codon:yes gene_type:complete
MGISFGALLGLVFFLAIPLFFIFLEGELSDPGIFIEPYLPFEDLVTTSNIFIGWSVVLLASMYEVNVIDKSNREINIKEYVESKKLLYFIICVYFIITIVTTITTGAFGEGVHWHDSSRNESSFFIIFKNFSNCYRVVVFGLILYLLNQGKVNRSKSIYIAVAFTVFDVLLSFNRITLLYFLLFFILSHRKYALLIFSSIVVVIPPVIYISSVWTWFRGMASISGIGFDSYLKSWNDAVILYESVGDRFVVKMNSIFESSNILVFHGLVEKVGDSIPIFYGSTYLVRPLTTFIPSTIWPDKPQVFGTYIGLYINNYEGLALNSTLFGEAYSNFMYFWPFVLLVTLMALTKLYSTASKYVYSINLMSIFIGVSIWRFDMNFTIACVYSLIFIIFITKFFGSKRLKF